MRNKNSTLTYRWFQEVWNEAKEESIDDMLDVNAVVHGIAGTSGPGPEGFKTFYRSFKEQFPQIHVEVDDVVSEDDCETARCTVQATDARGQAVRFEGMTFTRVRDGKIVEGWNNFDFLGMYNQMGFKMVRP